MSWRRGSSPRCTSIASYLCRTYSTASDATPWTRTVAATPTSSPPYPLNDVGLDFYHFAENVHKARRAVYGEEDPQDEKAPGNAWAASVLHLSKRVSYVKLEEAVWDWALSWQGPRREAALGLLNYMSEREE